MPSRAFLLFGLLILFCVAGATFLFQCPRGHFCFSDGNVKIIPLFPRKWFQCPRGHFCFSDALSEVGITTQIVE